MTTLTIESFQEDGAVVINNVGLYNLKMFFFVSRDDTTAEDHYNLVFDQAIFDNFGQTRYEFYEKIGYWAFTTKYRELICQNGDNCFTSFNQDLTNKIKNNFRLCYGESVQIEGNPQTT